MRGDNLKRHMKKHDIKPLSIDEVTEKIENDSTVDVAALNNKIVGVLMNINGY